MSPAITSRNNGYMLIFVLAITSSFAPLSVDFFAPSMPNATRDLATSTDAIQTTLYIFLIGYAVAPFLWGVLADRFGRRRVMLAGITVYGLASIGCSLSPGIFELSVMRLLQGVGAASGVVIARAVLRDIHGPAGTTKAISGMFLIMVWIPITAPVIGGYLSSHFSWRISFWIMALIAGLALVGSYLWQMETIPEKLPVDEQKNGNWHAVLINPVFVRHTLANMFCLGTMLLFISNYSYLGEQHYQLSSAAHGYVLAIFNAGISAGVYMVRLFVPRFGVESTIYLGLWVALTGWVALWGMCLIVVPAQTIILLPIVLACLGTGMVISLSVGQALVPFAYAAGAASALFVCVQSAGAAFISFFVTLSFNSTLTTITTALVLCALLAVASMKLIQPKQNRKGSETGFSQ
jgi:DHA1 family bicyclomycin/chloramphenicol resistance-like MFS transporter